jgi:hypothetical protein
VKLIFRLNVISIIKKDRMHKAAGLPISGISVLLPVSSSGFGKPEIAKRYQSNICVRTSGS